MLLHSRADAANQLLEEVPYIRHETILLLQWWPVSFTACPAQPSGTSLLNDVMGKQQPLPCSVNRKSKHLIAPSHSPRDLNHAPKSWLETSFQGICRLRWAVLHSGTHKGKHYQAAGRWCSTGRIARKLTSLRWQGWDCGLDCQVKSRVQRRRTRQCQTRTEPFIDKNGVWRRLASFLSWQGCSITSSHWQQEAKGNAWRSQSNRGSVTSSHWQQAQVSRLPTPAPPLLVKGFFTFISSYKQWALQHMILACPRCWIAMPLLYNKKQVIWEAE